MALTLLILATAILTGALLWSPRLRRFPAWTAMTTPLASIIGSGFLVLGPVLENAYGLWAPLVMAALCLAAFGFGAAVRHNIAQIGDSPGPCPTLRSTSEARLEDVASAALAFAYMISVAYYLNLLGSFATSLTPFDTPTVSRSITTAVFLLILVTGWTRGFALLERMEYASVTLKLAIIAGLLAGLLWYVGARAAEGALLLNPVTTSGWGAVTLAFGLLVTVQGFETSRYLGAEYDARTRIRSMTWAQGLSTAIYMVYIGLIAYAFPRTGAAVSETAIIDMMAIVAPILPLMLVAAALAAQFSAAVADTGGSGGLLAELTGKRLSPRQGYALLTLVGLTLTWRADVFQIISYASRAFAAYYTLQCLLAALSARRQGAGAKAAGFAALALLGAAITLFGQPVEG
ncbi:hypothetical protein [Pseudooceanicola nanhaiensis]|uniref:hypothetical protein n=1 Tax=Pseudooceanicola nanhaiensis TaxID=375761 RepID=UPI001CD6D053|nr:hypothetical protein [Pseudooceanicola nanhaiensis]MCA0922301.1 hypothetical protein [Pseudooceanicola nanhaiensis]